MAAELQEHPASLAGSTLRLLLCLCSGASTWLDRCRQRAHQAKCKRFTTTSPRDTEHASLGDTLTQRRLQACQHMSRPCHAPPFILWQALNLQLCPQLANA